MPSERSEPVPIQMSELIFYEGVYERLIADVEPYFIKLAEINATGIYPGNWATVRLLMPIVEAIAVATELQHRGYNARIYSLLEKLGIPFPPVVWDMYRNGLSHGEQPFGIKYKSHWIVWSMTTSHDDPDKVSHSVSGQEIHINTRTLFDDLKDYVSGQINQISTRVLPDRVLTIKTGKSYPDNYGGELKAYMEELVNNRQSQN